MSSESNECKDIDSDVSIHDTMNNMNHFQQLLKLCRDCKEFPQKYIEDMNRIYKNCNDKQKNEEKLCNSILLGIEHMSSKSKKSFQYAANVYNELLQLTISQTENNVASTSNGTSNVATELENGRSNKISKSNKIFKQIIEKCYANPNFPNSNIAIIDKLYDSLPIEFLDSKYFIKLIEEANQVIWPDSSKSLYVHIEYVHNQLNQFEASMKVQKRKISVEDKEINSKKLQKLKKLKNAFIEVCKQIKKLNDEEMDINCDDNFEINSPYILKDRYEKRALEIYKRMCKLRDEPDFLKEPPLRFKQTDNSLVNKTIEKYYNMNKIFPSYFEIYTLLKLLNEKKQLNWNETTLQNISQNAFLKLGKQLKIRRLNDYFGSLEAMITEKDPADDNPELKKKLDESSKKLYADLNELSKKFQNQQDYAEETEGSDLDDTECEHSSEDDNDNIKTNLNTELKYVNSSSVKRKRVSSNKPNKTNKSNISDKSDIDEPLQKSKKTIYLESFNLTPCNTPEKIINKTNNESNVATVKVPDIIASTKIISEKEDTQLNEITNKTKNLTDKKSNRIVENISNSPDHLKSKIVVHKEINTDNEEETLVVDKDISVGDGIHFKKLDQEIEEQKENKTNNFDSIVTEPEVIIHVDESPIKNVIEINEVDDSDVEITACDPPKVPKLLNKEYLDSIIQSRRFDKNCKPSIEKPKSSNSVILNCLGNEAIQNPISIPNPNMNNNLVNCWIMNNSNVTLPKINNPQISGNIVQSLRGNIVNPSRGNNVNPSRGNNVNPSKGNNVNPSRGNNVQPPRRNNVPIRNPNNNNNNNRPLPMSQNTQSMHRMQSTFQRSTTQTARQFTQQLMNSVPQQRNCMNNQSVVQQRVTTMTTTTTVQQIVQQSSRSVQSRRVGSHFHNRPLQRPSISESNSSNKPELIELD